MKSPFRQPSENEEDFEAMLSVSEHANQYAVHRKMTVFVVIEHIDVEEVNIKIFKSRVEALMFAQKINSGTTCAEMREVEVQE